MKSLCGIGFCVCLQLFTGSVAHAQQPAQQPSAQQPSAQPTPAQQPAAQQPPQQQPDQPPQGPVTNQPPPLPPRLPDQQMPDEGRFSVGIIGWMPMGHPYIDQGQNNIYYGYPQFSNIAHLTFQGTPQPQIGVDVTVPAGKHHDVRVTYMHSSAAGNVVAPYDLYLWNGNYSKGDYLSTDYRFRDLKISYDFMTWPWPIGNRKIRLKTLYQFQYISMASSFDAPLKSTVNGPNTASGKESIYLPTLGLGVDYYVTPNFRLEANGTGFYIPGHSYIIDSDATASYRISRVEVRAGMMFLRFRTSVQNDYVMRAMPVGLLVGLRFFLN